MRTPFIETELVVDRRSPASRAIAASAFLLRIGFVGASVFAVGIIALFDGDARPTTALASAILGGLVAAYAWRRSWILLSRAEIAEASPTEPARAAALGNPVELAAMR
jgi:hypothetical protein